MVSSTVADTYGALMALVVVCAILLGVLNVQVVHYFCRFRCDPLWLKQLVAFAFALEMLQQLFAFILVYYYLISHFGNKEFIELSQWPISLTVVTETLVCLVVQLYFIRRSWLLGRKQPLVPAVMSFFAFVQLLCGMWSCAIAATTKEIVGFIKWAPVELTWYGCNLADDILISWYIISSVRGARTGFKALDSRMRLLVIYTIGTAFITTGLSIGVMVTFNLVNPTLWYLGLSFVLSRVYSNLLLAALNLRGTWTKGADLCMLELDDLSDIPPAPIRGHPPNIVAIRPSSWARSSVIVIE